VYFHSLHPSVFFPSPPPPQTVPFLHSCPRYYYKNFSKIEHLLMCQCFLWLVLLFLYVVVIFLGKHSIVLHFVLLLDNYQVAFQTDCTFLCQNDDMCDNTDTRQKTKVDITWVLLLRYYIHLQRINNMSKLLGRFSVLKTTYPFL
jgi:hypothetical protein